MFSCQDENKREIKLVVVDTSALVSYPKVLERKDCIFFVPSMVIRQLDGLKNSDNSITSKASRSASYYIEKAQLNNRVFLLNHYDRIEGLDNASDNKIVGAAVYLARVLPDKKIYLLTTDRNMGIIANGYNLESFDFDEIDSGHNETRVRKKLPIWLHVVMWITIAMASLFPLFYEHPVYKYVGALGLILFAVWGCIAIFYVCDPDRFPISIDDPEEDDNFVDLGVWKGDRTRAGGLGRGMNARHHQ